MESEDDTQNGRSFWGCNVGRTNLKDGRDEYYGTGIGVCVCAVVSFVSQC